MATQNMRVLISGAGVAGNAIAWLLARTGAKVTVLEKSEAIIGQGQNVDLQGAALTALKHMGLLDELKKRNTTEKGTYFVAPNGKPFAHFPRVEGGVSLTNEYEILRSDLAEMLYDKARTEANVEYRFGVMVDQVLENNEKTVKVQFNDGSQETFDLLIAADGQWSKIRRTVFPANELTTIDKDAFCIYFTAERQPQDPDWWQIYHATNSRIISTRPDPYGTTRFCATVMPTSEKQRQQWKDAMRSDHKTQQELIRTTYAGAGWEADRFIEASSKAKDFYAHGLIQIKMKQWFQDRVVCIGDAAWAPTPLTGQGSTLAITGAYLLAAELEKVSAGGDVVDGLRSFDKLFHPHVDKMQDIPSFVPGIVHPATAWGRWVVQTCISIVATVLSWGPVKSRLGNQEGEKNDDGFPLPSYPSFEARL